MLEKLKTSYRRLFSRFNLFGWGAIALLIAAAGPFGTYEAQGFDERLFYWTVIVVLSATIGRGLHVVADHLTGGRRPFLSDLVMITLMSALFTPLLWALNRGLTQIDNDGSMTVLGLMPYVAMVTAGICVIRRSLPGFGKLGYFDRPSDPVEDLPRLARRLPEEFHGPILRLTVRDHFVDVVSAQANCTIRLRFGDAIEEMDTVDGFCTHRSHWVARSAIDGIDRDGGKVTIRLVNGDLVPVSRKYRADLEKAGIL